MTTPPILCALLTLALIATSAHAEEVEGGSPEGASGDGASLLARPGRVGVGLGGSTLTSGFTAKFYLSDAFAAQLHAGWWRGAGLSVGADLLVERPFFNNQDISFQWYVGGGPAVGLFSIDNRSTVVAASGVGGVGLHFGPVPLELTLEIRPTVILGSYYWNGFYFGSGGAIRYYF